MKKLFLYFFFFFIKVGNSYLFFPRIEWLIHEWESNNQWIESRIKIIGRNKSKIILGVRLIKQLTLDKIVLKCCIGWIRGIRNFASADFAGQRYREKSQEQQSQYKTRRRSGTENKKDPINHEERIRKKKRLRNKAGARGCWRNFIDFSTLEFTLFLISFLLLFTDWSSITPLTTPPNADRSSSLIAFPGITQSEVRFMAKPFISLLKNITTPADSNSNERAQSLILLLFPPIPLFLIPRWVYIIWITRVRYWIPQTKTGDTPRCKSHYQS